VPGRRGRAPKSSLIFEGTSETQWLVVARLISGLPFPDPSPDGVYNSQNVTLDVPAQLAAVKAQKIPYATITETPAS